jgi:cellulose synthase/poly-beta-1,6-N-acetylglucosamine synthase-like glycosyltransferase
VDADVVLEPEALLRVMAPVLRNRGEIVATGGIVRVANGCTIDNGAVQHVRLPRGPMEVLQVVEYLRGFLFGRGGWTALNSLLIISGAFGVFSRSAVLEIGGYRRDTVGEDMDLVVRLHRHMRERGRKYRIVFVPDPVCWTQVPSDVRSLVRQRRRWQKGLLDVLWRNRGMILDRRYGCVGVLGLFYQTTVELFGPMMELLGIVSILAAGFLGVLGWDALVFFLLIGYLAGSTISVSAVLLEDVIYRRYSTRRELVRLLAYAFLDFFPYRQFLMLANLAGMVEYFLNRRSWGEQRRLGFSPVGTAGR